MHDGTTEQPSCRKIAMIPCSLVGVVGNKCPTLKGMLIGNNQLVLGI